jgi:hypothetical protein
MKNEVGEVRPGQLITTYGPGAIMDSVNDSLVILDITFWRKNLQPIHDSRLASFLHKEMFRKIPAKGKNDLPAIPFPNFHVCSNNKCRRLFDIRESFNMESYLEKGPICPECEKKAYPSRFVISCNGGNHLDDFPWSWWAHQKSENFSCNGKLKLTNSGKNSGLSSMIVSCEKCDDWNHMGAATQKSSFTNKGLNCTGNHPHRLNEKLPCDGELIPLQRGASNVYFPVLRSAISIPEKKNIKREKFIELEDELNLAEKLFGESGLKRVYEHSLEDLNIFRSSEDFIENWSKYKNKEVSNGDGENLKRYDQIKEIEYEALTNLSKEIEDEKTFKAEEVLIPEDLKKYFVKIVKAHRLKEILVLLGFTRNDSPEPEVKDPGNIVWLGDRQTKWLPAVEIFGEGIFIEFNRESIKEWFDNNYEVQKRSEKYKNMYNNYLIRREWTQQSDKDVIYVLLHTFSHLLMKQFSLKSGYSSSAIKERIYYNDKMTGILLYTGSTDQEGSLGGLVEMGEVSKLRSVLVGALEDARFCSNDPNCAIQEPTDDNYINGASCFACTMLPETACETGNMLLDRSLLVKTMESNFTPFFDGLI